MFNESNPIYKYALNLFLLRSELYPRLDEKNIKELYLKHILKRIDLFLYICWYLCRIKIQEPRKAERTLEGEEVKNQDTNNRTIICDNHHHLCQTMIFTPIQSSPNCNILLLEYTQWGPAGVGARPRSREHVLAYV